MQQFRDREWVKNQWEKSNFGDARLNKRIINLAEKILNNPSSGLPSQTKNWGELKGAYRFLSNKKVDHKKIQSKHYANVHNEAEKKEQPVLFIQDTTELDYSSHISKKGELGPIGDHRGTGIMLHSCLAIVPGDVVDVIGLAQQTPWIRTEHKGRKKTETKAERKKEIQKQCIGKKPCNQ